MHIKHIYFLVIGGSKILHNFRRRGLRFVRAKIGNPPLPSKIVWVRIFKHLLSDFRKNTDIDNFLPKFGENYTF